MAVSGIVTIARAQLHGLEWQACLRKHQYRTRARAILAVRRYNAAHRGDSTPIKDYRCSHCRMWHIGHNRKALQ